MDASLRAERADFQFPLSIDRDHARPVSQERVEADVPGGTRQSVDPAEGHFSQAIRTHVRRQRKLRVAFGNAEEVEIASEEGAGRNVDAPGGIELAGLRERLSRPERLDDVLRPRIEIAQDPVLTVERNAHAGGHGDESDGNQDLDQRETPA